MFENIIKIHLYNNYKVVIENYNKIISINNDVINVDDYVINGDNLKIKKMDEYSIEISGIIKTINIIKNDDK